MCMCVCVHVCGVCSWCMCVCMQLVHVCVCVHVYGVCVAGACVCVCSWCMCVFACNSIPVICICVIWAGSQCPSSITQSLPQLRDWRSLPSLQLLKEQHDSKRREIISSTSSTSLHNNHLAIYPITTTLINLINTTFINLINIITTTFINPINTTSIFFTTPITTSYSTSLIYITTTFISMTP